MNEVSLNASKREEVGKQIAKTLRKTGKLPAVIYGGDHPPEPLALDYREFDAFMRKHRGENVLIDLKIDTDEPRKAILRDVQRDFLKDSMLHVDFQQISLTDRLTATVSIVLTGEAIGATALYGGILEQLQRELTIQCLASNMPEHLEVDVTALELGQSIHARDLSFPDIDIMTDEDAVIASVVAPMREEVVVEDEGTEIAEPEVIGQDKDDEGEEDENS